MTDPILNNYKIEDFPQDERFKIALSFPEDERLFVMHLLIPDFDRHIDLWRGKINGWETCKLHRKCMEAQKNPELYKGIKEIAWDKRNTTKYFGDERSDKEIEKETNEQL